MPEWADAIYVTGGTLLCVFAFRFGAAARSDPDRRDAAARWGRLLMLGGTTASSIGIGAFVGDDGSLDAGGWVLFLLAGMALSTGFTLRAGAGVLWERRRRSLGAWFLRYLVTAAVVSIGVFVGAETFDSGKSTPVEDADLLRSPEGADPAYSFERPDRWTVVTDSIEGRGGAGVVEVALLPPDVPAAALTVTRLSGDVAPGARLETLTPSVEEVLHGEVVRSRPASVGSEDALLHESRAPGGFRGRAALVVRDGAALVMALTARGVDWGEVSPAFDEVLGSWAWDTSD